MMEGNTLSNENTKFVIIENHLAGDHRLFIFLLLIMGSHVLSDYCDLGHQHMDACPQLAFFQLNSANIYIASSVCIIM